MITGALHQPDTVPTPSETSEPALDFDTVYGAWFDHVCRWLRAHGIPASDREDLAQEVFLVVERKLGGFDGRHLSAWLYKITKNTASDHRRRAWYKNLFRSRSDYEWETVSDGAGSPERQALTKDALRIVNEALSGMDRDHRTAFVLFEIEGYSGEQIASFEGIPIATVWTRLHYARKSFRAKAAAFGLERSPT